MSDPVHVAAAWLQDGGDVETTTANVLAAYERARVVCDECDGTGWLGVIIDTGEGLACPNAGPMLKGPDGPFHADADKLMWLCELPQELGTFWWLDTEPDEFCLGSTTEDHEPGCGWVARDQKVWSEEP